MSLPIKLQIPDSFYKEETLCGYHVTCKDKKIWAVELDLLNEFKTVCEKYHLTWYIAYGSLIGTIRHKGFIPWDNDVDVLMPRKDYQKLCEIASNEFQHPYFLSTPISEQGRFYRNFAKLCNSLTTGGCEDLWLQGVNCGLFIDIFVLDEFPDDDKKAAKLVKQVNFYEHLSRFFSPYERHDKGLKYIKNLYWTWLWKYRYKRCNGAALYRIVSSVLEKTMGHGYKRVGLIESAYNPDLLSDKSLWAVKWMPFEMIEVSVPIGYDTILRNRYGDYIQFPPVDERLTHAYMDLEPGIPYREYYSKMYQ